jgi:type II secretory pathway pseudopilin PulG
MTTMTTMATADRKISFKFQVSSFKFNNGPRTRNLKPGSNEKGYSLVSLMAMMTILAIAMLAVAPNVYQEVQREKELEAVRRGEEVARAIKEYVNFHQGAKLPNSIDDLLEGLPQGTKKRQILRESAAIDPLSEDGKWRLVGVESKAMVNFARRVQNYNNGALPSSEDIHRNVVNKMGVFLTNLNTESEDDIEGAADDTDDGGDLPTDNSPFIGVISQSQSKSVIAYYGIENHSKWVFTPLFRGRGLNVITGAGVPGPPPAPPAPPPNRP